jgi:hypothetical protein
MKNCEVIGTRVIVRTNEPGPFKVGTLIGEYKPKESWTTGVPVVKLDDGTDIYCMCKVIEHTPELEAELLELEWWQQYNRLVEEMYWLTEKEARRKEAYTRERAT